MLNNKIKSKKMICVLIMVFVSLFVLISFLYSSIDFCDPPYQKIGKMCCIPSDLLYMCQEEEGVFYNKFNDSIKDNIITKKTKMSKQDIPFSFIAPEGYYLVEDINMGGFDVPYYFIAYGDNGEDSIGIFLIYEKVEPYSYSKENRDIFFDNYRKDVYDQINRRHSILDSIDNVRFKNKNGVDGLAIEVFDKMPTYGKEYYHKSVFFVDEGKGAIVLLKFVTVRRYVGHVNDFNELVDSFDFETDYF